jgi:hypothetical protein
MGGISLDGVYIELKCPAHGFERYTVKIKRRFNMRSDVIEPHYRSRPTHELSCLLVGRNVDEAEVQSYMINYLRERGLWERIVTFKLV